MFAEAGQAQTFTWNNPAGGVYGTGSNWSPLGPPTTTAHTGVFSDQGLYTVTLNADHGIGALRVTGGNQKTFNAAGRTFNVLSLAQFNTQTTWNGGTLSLSVVGDVDVNGSFNAGTSTFVRARNVFVAGNASINASTLTANFARVSGGFGQLTLLNGSVATLSLGADLGQPGAASGGSLSVQGGSSLHVNTLNVNVTDVVTPLIGSTANSQVVVTGANSNITQSGSAALTVGGGTFATDSLPTRIIRAAEVINSATFTTGTGPIQINFGGALTNTGTFSANGDMTSSGLISNGGTFALSPTRTLRIERSNFQVVSGTFGNVIAPVPGLTSTGTMSGGTLVVGSAPLSTGSVQFASFNAGTSSFAVTVVGGAGAGSAELRRFNTGSLIIGQAATGAGTTNVFGLFGTSGTLSSGSLLVGGLGDGSLNIGSSGFVSTTSGGTIGGSSGGNGWINLAGGGSTSPATYSAPGQRLSVGSAGRGTLSLGSFASLNVATLDIGAGAGAGTVILSAGSLLLPSIKLNPNGNFVLNGGELNTSIFNLGSFFYNGGAINDEFINGGTLHLNAPLNTQIENDANGRIVSDTQSFSGSGTIFNIGSFGGTGTVLSGLTVLNHGVISSAGGDFVIEPGVILTNVSTGTLRNAPASTLRVRLAAFSNQGNIEVNAGGAVEFTSSLSIPSSRRATLNGGLLITPTLSIPAGGTVQGYGHLAGNLNNSGTASFYGPMTVQGSLVNAAGGVLKVRNAATLVYGAAINNGSIITSSGGTIIFDSAQAASGPELAAGGLDGTGALSVSPGSAAVANYIRQDSIRLDGTPAERARVTIRPTNFGGDTSRAGTFSIAGTPAAYFGQLDLADTALIVDYTGPSPIATIASYLTSGHANGAWTGNGISSSTAAAQANRALGYAHATDIGSPAVFAGQSIDATSVLVRFTLPGDTDLTGTVDIDDFGRLASSFNTPGGWAAGDFNYSGMIDIDDFALLATNFNQSIPGGLAARPSAVPEPGVGVLAGLLAGSTVRRRRRTA